MGVEMLDDIARIGQIDKSHMLDLLETFPDQISEIVSKVKKMKISGFKQKTFKPKLIFVLGMGGSAISGDLLSAWLEDRDKIVINTVRNYSVPISIDSDTLVFACSYSGNTEETMSAVESAFEKGSKIIAITSGGKLRSFCKTKKLPVIDIPKGLAPRAAVAFLFFPMVVILEKLGVIKPVTELSGLIKELKKIKNSYKPEIPQKRNRAKEMAVSLSKGIPYIYGHTYLSVIAKRWKTQLNENAKVLAMNGELPEMNHNEIVGWSGDNQEIANRFVVVFLRSSDEHPRIKKRLELTKKMLNAIVSEVIEFNVVGKNKLTRMITTMYIGDYISIYLALLRELDPTPVVSIERFKKLMES